jgi:hypothetical protein
MLFLFTKYRSLTLLSFESFHIGLIREMFTPRQSTVSEVTRGIRRSMPMMLCACCPTSSGESHYMTIPQLSHIMKNKKTLSFILQYVLLCLWDVHQLI